MDSTPTQIFQTPSGPTSTNSDIISTLPLNATMSVELSYKVGELVLKKIKDYPDGAKTVGLYLKNSKGFLSQLACFWHKNGVVSLLEGPALFALNNQVLNLVDWYKAQLN